MFDYSPYGTKTTDEVLKVVENLKLKGYQLTKNNNSYGNCAYKENFFIWKKDNCKEFLRLCLMSKGWHENKFFWWEIDFNFKPFSKIKCDKWGSEQFKGTAEDLCLNRFYESINQIKLYLNLKKLKGGLGK